MKKMNSTIESAKTAILATFNFDTIDAENLLENMQVVKNGLSPTEEFKHSAFAELIEIMKDFLAILQEDFNNNPPAWAEKRLKDAFKSVSTVACVLCDGKISSPLMKKFVTDVISLANVQLEDMLIDTLPLVLK